MEDADTDTLSFYAVLNVGREATQEEITKAYRRLATVFHPDKHIDPQLRHQAQESFAKIQEAYEVLSDQTKRAIYDVYGKQGLAAGGSSTACPGWTDANNPECMLVH
jgi:DnaJ family protein C protein 11